jgi:hypothetical protein
LKTTLAAVRRIAERDSLKQAPAQAQAHNADHYDDQVQVPAGRAARQDADERADDRNRNDDSISPA